MRTQSALVLSMACLLASCVQPSLDSSSSDVARTALPIVGGNAESGWPGVGALTMTQPGYGYVGAFCTGTLIAPQWVLTAAHCLVDDGLTASMTKFYIGSDATPSGGDGVPSTGTLHQADALYYNEDYDDATTDYDVGLVHLAQAVTGATVYAYNTNAMTSDMVGKNAFYVGFGANDGINESGSGIKRSGNMQIAAIDDGSHQKYESQYVTSGVCFGDSGGPGFYDFSTVPGTHTWRVIGINSTVSNTPGADPCEGEAFQTRTDVMATWIATQMGTPPPNCHTQPSVCPCTAACQVDGSCLYSACQTKTCAQVVDCMDSCSDTNQSCLMSCYIGGTVAAQQLYDAEAQCFDDNCAQFTDPTQYSNCAWAHCASQIDACQPPANCAMTGGGCPSGNACWPTASNHTDCFPSDGLVLGANCNPSITSRIVCADGLLCDGSGTHGVCRKFCQNNQGCASGEQCIGPVFTGIASLGVCEPKGAVKDGGTVLQGDGGTAADEDSGVAGDDDAGSGVENGGGNSGCEIGGRGGKASSPLCLALGLAAFAALLQRKRRLFQRG